MNSYPKKADQAERKQFKDGNLPGVKPKTTLFTVNNLNFSLRGKAYQQDLQLNGFFCCLFTYIAKQVSKSFLIRSLGVKAIGETGQKGMVFPEIQVIDWLNASHAVLFRPSQSPLPLGKPGYSGGSQCLACKRSSLIVEMRIEWPESRTLTTPNAGEGVERQELSLLLGICKLIQALWKTVQSYSYILIQQPSFFDIYPKELKLVPIQELAHECLQELYA